MDNKEEDLKKYIKAHENELVENHIKGLLGRAVAMTLTSIQQTICLIYA